jgi:cell division topological specificity factor
MRKAVFSGNYSGVNKMSLLDYFRSSKASSASLAKERLQILVAYERSSDSQPAYLPELQKELLAVIQRYVNINKDAMTINLEQTDNQETLELNIVLPDAHRV